MQNDIHISEQEMQRKGRMVFVYMLIFFIVPIIVVVMMYQLNWKPNGGSLGELVTPPRLLSQSTELKTNDAKLLMPLFWKERWSIVYVTADCQKICLDRLHDMRQLHVSLYKDMPRAQRVLITSMQDVTAIKNDFPDLFIINQPVVEALNLSQQFQLKDESVMASNRLYLVDPLGHLMMSYQSAVPLADVRKDLIRLLRYSWAG